jgi:hypothetical protein
VAAGAAVARTGHLTQFLQIADGLRGQGIDQVRFRDAQTATDKLLHVVLTRSAATFTHGPHQAGGIDIETQSQYLNCNRTWDLVKGRKEFDLSFRAQP